jgi:hypothetical protein
LLTRDDFLGLWQVTRRITDRHGQMQGRFDGQAEISASGADGADYAESGQMRLGNAPVMQATRRYLWQFTPGLVQVCFDDGRAFHNFVPKGQGAGSDHPCGADYYRVIYDFTLWPDWRATWHVSGPRKDYTSVTDYTGQVG